MEIRPVLLLLCCAYGVTGVDIQKCCDSDEVIDLVSQECIKWNGASAALKDFPINPNLIDVRTARNEELKCTPVDQQPSFNLKGPFPSCNLATHKNVL